MQYEHTHSHYASFSLPSNRNTVLRWKASQRALKQPLRFLDPALRALYLSAMELQTWSPNIVACNPCKREAEEIPYPLTQGKPPRAVAISALGAYARAHRLGWCCWCSLCSDRPKFANLVQDRSHPFLECYECGFYVPLYKIYETATDLGGYPNSANGALQPFIKAIAIPPPEGKRLYRTSRQKIHREYSTPYGLRPDLKVKVERDSSPEMPDNLDEILADIKISDDKRKNKNDQNTPRRQRRSVRTARSRAKHQPMEIYEEAAADGNEDTRIEFCPYCGAGVVEDLLDQHLKEDCNEYANYGSN